MVDRERTAAEWLQEGHHWLHEGVYDAALECGEKALAQSPGNPDVLFFLGKRSEDLERLAVARTYFEQILALNPTWNDGAAARALEGVQRQLDSADEALSNCRQMLRMDKFCAEAFFSIALWLRRLGMLDDALTNLEDAKACGWAREDVLVEMGEVQMELGHEAAATECFREAVEIDATLADAWYGQAVALRKLGRWREALPSIERSLQLSTTASAQWLRDVILDALREPEAPAAKS